MAKLWEITPSVLAEIPTHINVVKIKYNIYLITMSINHYLYTILDASCLFVCLFEKLKRRGPIEVFGVADH
jgi:hypothetical protein